MKTTLSSYIDHTLLKPESTTEQVLKTVDEALKFRFYGVCVNSCFISLVAEKLAPSLNQGGPLPVAVVGFPLGAMTSKAKAFEAELCVRSGAREIDMVLPVGLLKEKNDAAVLEDIRSVVKAVADQSASAIVKVIIETGLLSHDEKIRATHLCVEAGAHFVKTSTGFHSVLTADGKPGSTGATLDDIKLIKSIVGNQARIKASGGVKTTEMAWALIKAGADRLGTSSGVMLVQGDPSTSGGY